jgi:hypothetical protein
VARAAANLSSFACALHLHLESLCSFDGDVSLVESALMLLLFAVYEVHCMLRVTHNVRV